MLNIPHGRVKISSRQRRIQILVVIALKFDLARRKFAFPVRIAKTLSNLPPENVDAASSVIFKLRLNGVCFLTLLGHRMVFQVSVSSSVCLFFDEKVPSA